jgi:5-methylcytosine-specific restriction protein A
MAVWPYSTQHWLRLRKQKLQDRPLCELCMELGYIEPATAVDHITPINKGGDPYPALEALRSLCASCHNMKTRHEQLGQDYTVKGCDVFGRPLDPRHPWSKRRTGNA